MGNGKFSNGVESNKPTQASHVEEKEIDGNSHSLDLFSTSPTYPEELCFADCIYGAPFFAYNTHDKVYGISQGCCNHWDCPRCGIKRAKTEYGRIVEGIRQLAEHDQIWFITVTCRGRKMTKDESEKSYGEWTNKLLDSWRLQSKRTHQKWAYVQVTERQERGHPHSHILTTFCPTDVIPYSWKKTRVSVEGKQFMAYVSSYRSEYLRSSVIRSGLGEQYDITPAGKIEAVSRYVAKYLFKGNIFNDKWPKGWKRVRYSQSFPKLKREKTDAFVLLKRDDWQKLARVALMVSIHESRALSEAEFWLKGSDVLINYKR
jgi:hypothetical protein